MDLIQFFNKQIAVWNGRGKLSQVETRELDCGEYTVTLQHNPSRIVSTAAKIDKASIKQRKCFLCNDGRLENQMSLSINLSGEEYDILVNPYPILPYHFTIACRNHVPQRIIGRETVFSQLLNAYSGLTVFYNGPLSGASAPDHLHFQASVSKILPIQKQWSKIKSGKYSLSVSKCLTISKYISPIYAISTCSEDEFNDTLQHVIASLPLIEDSVEPRLNIIAWREANSYEAAIIPRFKHRPDSYFLEGENKILVSPGSLDMAGLIITPRKEDFLRIDSASVEEIMRQCGSHAFVPLSVGLMHRTCVSITFNGPFYSANGLVQGSQSISLVDNKIVWQDKKYDKLIIKPASSNSTFTLNEVEIGTGFHWQQLQTETFYGSVQFIIDRGEILVVNHIDVETYLESVIGSEMSATSPIELLKAHAVISRSWVISQIRQRYFNPSSDIEHGVDSNHVHIKWYDHDAHTLFDVCADDHCQRYQGIPQKAKENAIDAVRSTQNQILTYNDEIIDARFSKCCGGITENFGTCWDATPKPYLPAIVDRDDNVKDFRPINTEEMAHEWIMNHPKTFCGSISKQAIESSLNMYDQQTNDAYRWTVKITQQELQLLLKEKIGFYGGNILSLQPLQRGVSGRISLLRINAETDYIDIGKELEIRRALSRTHLYSSAFIVEAITSHGSNIPEIFVLHGAGWGHGVGLCQIGAAQMASLGYNYKDILHHYYLCKLSMIAEL